MTSKVYAYTKNASVANIGEEFDEIERTKNGTLFYLKKNLVLYLPNDIIFTSVTTPGAPTTSYTSADFTTNTFQVTTVLTANTFRVIQH